MLLTPPVLQIIEPLLFIQPGALHGLATIFRFGLIASASLIIGMIRPVSWLVSAKALPELSREVQCLLAAVKSDDVIGTRQNWKPTASAEAVPKILFISVE